MIEPDKSTNPHLPLGSVPNSKDFQWDLWTDDMYQTVVQRAQHGDLNDAERVILTVGMLSIQSWNNGLFAVYNFVPQEFAWGEYSASLRRIGAPRLAAIIDRAESAIREHQSGSLTAELLEQTIKALEVEYFACSELNDVIDKEYAFIVANRDQFPQQTLRERELGPAE
jgi:hypothetical protein